jgi:hypothetical protein
VVIVLKSSFFLSFKAGGGGGSGFGFTGSVAAISVLAVLGPDSFTTGSGCRGGVVGFACVLLSVLAVAPGVLVVFEELPGTGLAGLVVEAGGFDATAGGLVAGVEGLVEAGGLAAVDGGFVVADFVVPCGLFTGGLLAGGVGFALVGGLFTR